MFPGSNLAYAILYPAIGRVVLKEVEVESETRSKIKKFSHEVTKYSKIFKDFKLENPFSWLSVGSDLMNMAVDQEDSLILDFEEFYANKGYVLVEDAAMVEITELLKTIKFTRVHKREGYEALKINVPGENVILQRAQDGTDVWYFYAKFDEDNQTIEGVKDEILKFFSDKIYEFYGKHISLRYDRSAYAFLPKKASIKEKKFFGKQKDIITYLNKAKDKGVRRSILFQGKPGMGKSVLCSECARLLDLRTLIIDNKTLTQITMSSWRELLKLYQPQLIIVDDIDRVASLESKLSLFEEENTQNVDFILFTSNNVDNIPLAFRRPGRIDRIIFVETPGDKETRLIIKKLAKREKALQYMDESKYKHCVKLAHKLSFTHVVEFLRQLYIFDGEIQEFVGDKTFEVYEHENISEVSKETPDEEIDPSIDAEATQKLKNQLIEDGFPADEIDELDIKVMKPGVDGQLNGPLPDY